MVLSLSESARVHKITVKTPFFSEFGFRGSDLDDSQLQGRQDVLRPHGHLGHRVQTNSIAAISVESPRRRCGSAMTLQ